MQLYKTAQSIIIVHNDACYISLESNWDTCINRDALYDELLNEISTTKPVGNLQWLGSQQIVAPIGTQEVWAAGVTYLRSKTARMEESKESGAANFYDKVYDAERPELFFKANGAKVVGPNREVRIRKDSIWNVPEPELTLVITSSSKIVGYSIGNDMSSRSIEGENPLYLPQAKMYDGSAAIGPCVLVVKKPIAATSNISMQIVRQGKQVFAGSTTIDRMKRTHQELVEFLFREYSHPVGCYLMTGTCVVPDNDFTLKAGDIISMRIDSIGILMNSVA